MARFPFTSNLTPGYTPELAAQIARTYPGMAHFADTGPFGATCGECTFYGCWKQRRNTAGEIVSTTKVEGACAKFHALTGKLGAAVPPGASACRHFERSRES